MKLLSYYWVPAILILTAFGVRFTDFYFGGDGDGFDGFMFRFGQLDWLGIPCFIAARMLYQIKVKGK